MYTYIYTPMHRGGNNICLHLGASRAPSFRNSEALIRIKGALTQQAATRKCWGPENVNVLSPLPCAYLISAP